MGLDLFLVSNMVFIKMIAIVYLLVNLSVSTVQSYLLIRIFAFLSKHRGKYPSPRASTFADDYGSYSAKETIKSVIFTLTGQIVFLVLYTTYF